MSTFLSVRALHEEGVPKKAIARRLGIDRRTVRKYVRRIEAGVNEPRRARVVRKLDPWRKLIEAKMQKGLSAVQIYQDLCREPAFNASYETVKRLVRELRPVDVKTYCRLNFLAGEEAQVDFGDIGRLRVEGRMQRVYLFAMTLCHSRYSYYDLVTDQTVPTFLDAIRRGFEFFGGVPGRLRPDNLRSAVLLNHLGERYYQQDFFCFCRHYGTVPDAARPHTPTDKGRVERDIGYVKGNWLRGRDFEDFEAARADLARWRDQVANVRVHGTTRRRPADLFEEERSSLRPLPEDPFEISTWGRYKVHKDIHVRVEGNYYSVPWRFAERTVTVRLREQEVTVFADNDLVATHTRSRDKGVTVTDAGHLPATKQMATQEIHRRRVMRIREAGPHAAQFLACLRQSRFVQRDQVLRMVRLVETWGPEAVERACQRALFFGAVDSSVRVEAILTRGLHEQPLPDEPNEPVADSSRDFGRPLAEYGALVGFGEVA